MFRVKQDVRIKKPLGTCCGVGNCGTTTKVKDLFFTSPFSQGDRRMVYELETGDIVLEEQLEVV